MGELLRVLLVDDDAADAELTRAALAGSHARRFQVTHVTRAGSALECLRRESFHVLLLDLGLPDSQGLTTLDAIRQEHDDLPIVVLTGLSDEKTALESLDRGSQDYLVKGTALPGNLERSICYAIQRQRQHRALAVTNEQLAQKNQWLQTLNETARQFVDNVSHDFRTPLAVIREFASILYEGMNGPVNSQQQEYLGVIMARVDELALMVDDLLDVSRLEAGLLGLWRRAAPPSELIERVRVVLERRAASSHRCLEIAVDDSLPLVYCDVEKIGRVIVNLAVNAIKFTPAGGRVDVWVRARSGGQEVAFGVTDTGPGIAAEKLPAIFERFKQVGANAKAKAEGLGLGLNIARQLVHLNLGAMHVESIPGQGSVFSFTLPVADPLIVFDRYLDMARASAAESPAVSSSLSLLRAEVSTGGDAKLLAAANAFLQTAVGSHDLAYRIDEQHWALAVRRQQDDLNALIEQITKEWAEFGENRPSGALPQLHIETIGSWRADKRRAELVEAFRNIVGGDASKTSAKRVLLVDDDRDLIESLRMRMQAAGFVVIAAGDGREGVQRAVKDRPDVIVLDVRMPILDGLSALGEIKQRDETRNIPVVILSASIGDRQESKKRGARFFIQKPFDSGDVISAIQTSLLETCLV
jgi:signal transduction histidine kinase